MDIHISNAAVICITVCVTVCAIALELIMSRKIK